MERNKRRILSGEVVSASGDKTISVLVKGYKKHRLYGKRVLQTKKFAAHDEENTCEVGDVVRIVETRPLSKTKRFRLLEVLEKKS
jgi:small subunit ribosomal protein S17